MAISIPPKFAARWSWFAVTGAAALLLVSAAPTLRAAPAQARATAPKAASSGPVRAEASPQLFATMCALYAAGFQSGVNVPNSDPALNNLRDQLLALHGPATEALRSYYREHVLSDSGATLARYVSYALVAGPAPKFSLSLNQDQLPPDVLELDGFGDLLANFYQEAGVEKLWNQFQPAYDDDISSVLQPLSSLVQLETGYLRDLLPPDGRTFTVYVEPLVGGRTNVRNIGDHYAIVVSPGSDSMGQIRHAFLHFLLDPLPIRYEKNIQPQKPLLLIASKAPRLPVEFRNDYSAFFTECFVRAVELRLRHLAPEKQAEEVGSAEADGYVLIRPIMAGLLNFEKAAPAMTYYFPDLVRSIDLAKETNRVQTLAFLPGTPSQSGPAEANAGILAAAEAAAGAGPKLPPDLVAALSEGERQIASRDAAGAAATFQSVLDKTPGQPRALYGLAIASALQGNADRAGDLFEQIIAAAANPANAGSAVAQVDAVSLAWSHVYLGRMHDLAGERDKALLEYSAALAVTDAPQAARTAAQHGVEEGYKPAAPPKAATE